MAEVILDWFDEGLNVDKFHLVGHSLGGQMCGVIGRSVHKKTRGETQVVRISALDPGELTFNDSFFIMFTILHMFYCLLLFMVSLKQLFRDFIHHLEHRLSIKTMQNSWTLFIQMLGFMEYQLALVTSTFGQIVANHCNQVARGAEFF